MDLQAGYHENIRQGAVEPHFQRPKSRVPLLDHDAGALESRVVHRRSNRSDSAGRYPPVSVDERQQPSAVVESVADYGGKVMFASETPQPLA